MNLKYTLDRAINDLNNKYHPHSKLNGGKGFLDVVESVPTELSSPAHAHSRLQERLNTKKLQDNGIIPQQNLTFGESTSEM